MYCNGDGKRKRVRALRYDATSIPGLHDVLSFSIHSDQRMSSGLTELAEHRIYGVEGRVYFLPNLRPGRKKVSADGFKPLLLDDHRNGRRG